MDRCTSKRMMPDVMVMTATHHHHSHAWKLLMNHLLPAPYAPMGSRERSNGPSVRPMAAKAGQGGQASSSGDKWAVPRGTDRYPVSPVK